MSVLINVIYLILNLFVIVLNSISKCRENSLQLVLPQALAILMRSALSLLDFEGKRFDKKLSLTMVMFFIILSLGSINVMFNFMLGKGKRKVQFLVTSVSTLIGVTGAMKMEKKLKGNIFQILSSLFGNKDNIVTFVLMFVASISIIMFFDYVVYG